MKKEYITPATVSVPCRCHTPLLTLSQELLVPIIVNDDEEVDLDEEGL